MKRKRGYAWRNQSSYATMPFKRPGAEVKILKTQVDLFKKALQSINRKVAKLKKMQTNGQVRKKRMLRLLIVSSDTHAFADLTSFLKKKTDINLSWATNGQIALNIIKNNPFDMAIVDDLLADMAGLGFVKKLVNINPMINSALVSKLSHDKFHQQTEGLGILAQLPKKPDEKHTKDLLEQLKKIIG